ncbi:hypothetical protein [Pontiella sulfatireligans]|uniref:Uncharacterized protein n=1 Tax=Pontiella sulfatireligans TaxID=2750658 RepID=A0A6C2US98_9BACT|nr:hypothetical protein [Pontiella sulfatireligans]VGO23128.1 hypothetical protein SCARR_05231 [Pontiella sulfatireligans]
MDLASKILEMLAEGNGLKASQMAKQLNVDRKQINATLYGPLPPCCGPSPGERFVGDA